MFSLVVDTNIFAFACGSTDETDKWFKCLNSISHILGSEEYRFALDNEDQILNEYKSVIEAQQNQFAKYLAKKMQEDIYRSEGESNFVKYPLLPKSQVEDLLEDGFDPSDIKFVRLAPNTNSETIASDDGSSFLDDEFLLRLEEDFELTIIDSDELHEMLINS